MEMGVPTAEELANPTVEQLENRLLVIPSMVATGMISPEQARELTKKGLKDLTEKLIPSGTTPQSP